jgi:hypothetical protein
VIVCQMSRTVPVMSLGALTKPPTTTAASMKMARSAKRRFSRKISATRLAFIAKPGELVPDVPGAPTR